MTVAIQPAGSPASREHYLDTVEKPVKLSEYQELIGNNFDLLQKVSTDGRIALWGVTPGIKNVNVSKYNRLSKGDLVIFTRDKKVFASAQITLLFQNKKFAEDLWGKDSRNQTWEYMYALDEIKPQDISYEDLQRAIKSSSGDNFMGFRVLDENKSNAVLELLGIASGSVMNRSLNFWWVNQGKTYKHEVGQDFMWAPITKSDGKEINSYNNMKRLSPGDIVFSHSKNAIRAIGIVQSKSYKAPQPDFKGDGSSNWSEIGWYCDVIFNELKLPIDYKLMIEKIRPLLPTKYSPIDRNGNAVLSYLFKIDQSLGKLLLDSSEIEQEIIDSLAVRAEVESQIELDDLEEQKIFQKQNLGPLEKENLVKSRRGQGVFKTNVKMYESSCRVTGLKDRSHLTASHIKPWGKSSDQEKIDGNNGLLLSPHVDRLFNYGYISFQNNGDILVSSKLRKEVLDAWSIIPKNVGKFRLEQFAYLEYHRKNIFKE